MVFAFLLYKFVLALFLILLLILENIKKRLKGCLRDVRKLLNGLYLIFGLNKSEKAFLCNKSECVARWVIIFTLTRNQFQQYNLSCSSRLFRHGILFLTNFELKLHEEAISILIWMFKHDLHSKLTMKFSTGCKTNFRDVFEISIATALFQFRPELLIEEMPHNKHR